MGAGRVGKLIIYLTIQAAFVLLQSIKGESTSHSPTKPESSAVDIKGAQHRSSEYGEGRAPWDADVTKFVKPDYPAELRARHIEGSGLFRTTLDVKTGYVTDLAVFVGGAGVRRSGKKSTYL